MASKTFEEVLKNLPEKSKQELGQSIDGLRGEVANTANKTIQQTNSTEVTQHSTPNDTYLDAHRTAAPTAEKGNSATVSEVSNTTPSTETPQPTPEPDKDR